MQSPKNSVRLPESQLDAIAWLMPFVLPPTNTFLSRIPFQVLLFAMLRKQFVDVFFCHHFVLRKLYYKRRRKEKKIVKRLLKHWVERGATYEHLQHMLELILQHKFE